MKDNYSCEKIKETLSAYIDGEISDNETLLIENHLADCNSCKNELSILENISSKIKGSLFSEEIDIPDFSESIMNRLSEKQDISCDIVNEELSAYFDAEIKPILYYSIEEHLKNCPKCNEKYQKLEVLRNLIKLSVDSLDIDLWKKIYQRLIQPDHIECNFVSEQLSAYIDKEINADLYKSISEHVLSCQQCRKELNELKYIQQNIKKALLKPFNNIDLWPSIRYKLNKDSRNKTFIWSTAASFIMVILVWNVLSIMYPVEDLNTASNFMVLTPANEEERNARTVADAYVRPADRFTDHLATSSDGYLFTSALSTPPSGVIPIMYQDDDYGF
ncbi:MAG: zf-HC2 domain-containing protein [Cyanobacteriota bacterium]